MALAGIKCKYLHVSRNLRYISFNLKSKGTGNELLWLVAMTNGFLTLYVLGSLFLYWVGNHYLVYHKKIKKKSLIRVISLNYIKNVYIKNQSTNDVSYKCVFMICLIRF